ncbi:hypothetical protein [Flavobacterium sp. HSC-61S13]|uniref:hypothetical protein n=1 Tax=Flavobacterium sp. HSC-61S13 TaxID=2910963 RepID=UPI00209F05DB|nr:hypothetical protein [Flavobacterium sp. HSC-61S13]MCP1996690.1 hypothetical protein [Flavobacterium sp. HSC-61S13]
MEEEKSIIVSHPERMQLLLNTLETNASSLANDLGYKNQMSIYFVLKGRNKITEQMIKKIIKIYPAVSYLFLAYGELPVIVPPAIAQSQKNMFGEVSNLEGLNSKLELLFKSQNRLLHKMDNIEKLLQEVLDRKGI